MGFGEEVNMANLNWGEQGNINHFRDQEAETSLELISATKEHKHK